MDETQHASDPTAPAFTDAEVNAQARGNAAAVIYALLALAKDCGRTPAQAATFVGRAFAPSWAGAQAEGADHIARGMALNCLTCGGAVRALGGDAAHAEARIAGFPTAEDAAVFGLTRDEADALYGLYGPVADSLGVAYAWRREGDEILLTVDR